MEARGALPGEELADGRVPDALEELAGGRVGHVGGARGRRGGLLRFFVDRGEDL